jgi:hypothetical protein
MKLKVGDKVRIRKDLKVGEIYGSLRLLRSMKRYLGNVCTITDIDDDGDFDVEENGFFWSKEMLEPVGNNKLIFNDNATILLKDGKRYISKCQSGDTYDREKGVLLCLAKANGYTYNDICEMLNKAEYQDEKSDAVKSNGVREVKRPAKVGEYVKVVDATSCGIDDYTNGDILKIIRKENGMFGKRYYYKNERYKYIIEPEYVVLENYTPYKITLSEFWANKGKKNMAIHCKTEAETNELSNAFDRMGQVWYSGSKYTDLNFGGEDVCYTNNNKFYNYICHEEAVDNIGKIKIYEFNEVDLSK